MAGKKLAQAQQAAPQMCLDCSEREARSLRGLRLREPVEENVRNASTLSRSEKSEQRSHVTAGRLASVMWIVGTSRSVIGGLWIPLPTVGRQVRPAPATAEPIQAKTARHDHHPSPSRCPPRIEVTGLLPNPHENILCNLLGLVRIGKDALCEGKDPAGMAVIELPEGCDLSACNPRQAIGIKQIVSIADGCGVVGHVSSSAPVIALDRTDLQQGDPATRKAAAYG
ncbi:MAG TPA: hypothetical protein VGA56_25135 [Opitutaceae bacterium]